MPRAAGSSGTYDFQLVNKATGKTDPNYHIQLDSVTTIIKRVVAAPAIVGWAGRVMRDNISGLVSTLVDAGVEPGKILEAMSDPDDFEEYLKAERLMPEDVRDDRGDEGTTEHAFLEKLAEVSVEIDEAEADKLAEKALTEEGYTGYARGIAQWWLDTQPRVIGGEVFVYSLEHRFAGTVDLVYLDEDGVLCILDLKTRGDDKGAYVSDHIQVCAYQIAYMEMTGREVSDVSVLVAHPDGSYLEVVSDLDPRAFLDVLALDRKLRDVR